MEKERLRTLLGSPLAVLGSLAASPHLRYHRWGFEGGVSMQIDFTKLLGFNTVSNELPDGLDFKGDSIGARLGAKVGTEVTPETKAIQFSKLLGFDIATDELSKGLDLQDETLSAKLGAKVGPPEVTSPATRIDFGGEAQGARLGAKVGFESGGG